MFEREIREARGVEKCGQGFEIMSACVWRMETYIYLGESLIFIRLDLIQLVSESCNTIVLGHGFCIGAITIYYTAESIR